MEGRGEDKPEIQLYNVKEGQDPDASKPKKGDAGFNWYYRIRFKGTFRQQFKLQAFPFDVQELTVRVRLKNECKLVHVPWGPTGDAASCDPGAIEEDFKLKRAEVRATYLPSYKFGKLCGYDPEAQVVFTVKRNAEYWIYNYGYLMSMVCTFAFAAFSLPIGDVGDRLGVGFTLNLTVVATFYLMQDKLPNCSYHTELESHLVVCIVFTMVVMFINCLPALIGESIVAQFERTVVISLMLIWLGYHAYMKVRCNSLLEGNIPPSVGQSVSRASSTLLSRAGKGE